MTFDPTTAVPEDQFDPTSALPESTPSTREVIKAAVTFNPDQAAQADQLRKKYPLPPDTLVRNLQNVQLQELVDKHDRTLQTSPKLSQYMREKPWLAAQAHDDIEPLKEVESSFAALGAAGAGQAVLGISEGIWRTPDAAQRLVGYLASIPEMAGLPQYLNPIRGVQDFIRIFSEGRLPVGPKFMSGTTDVANMVGRSQDILSEDRATFGDAFADLGVLSQNADQALRTALETGQVDQLRQVITDPNYWAAFMGQAVPSLYAAIKSGGSTAFMAWLEGMEQASSAADFEARTGVKVSDAEFTQATMQTALVNSFLEKAGLDKVLGAQGRGLKGIVAAAFAEGGTEALQQINTNLAALLAYDEGRELLEGVVSSAMGGFGSGGGIATVTNAATKAQEVLDARLRQGEDATRHADKLTAAMQAAAQSKLRERNPETFKQLMQQMAADTDGAPKSVFIDAQVLAQSGVNVAEVFPSAAEQMEGALATNSMVEVDIGEVLTVVPGSPLEQVFLQNARATETSLSLAEVQQAEAQAQEFIQQEAERVLQEAQDQEAWQASSQAVQQTILGQLNATGRFTPDVNEAYATLQANFFSAMAARTGTTPQELYQQWSLKVASRGMPGDVLNAGTPAVELGGRQIPITLNRQDERAGYRLAPVNVAAFDAGFRAADNEFQAEMYVGPGGTGAAIGDRYHRFGEFAATAPSIEAPTVSVDAQGRVSFGNGRHRFAFMRDSGVPSVPVAMDEESLQNAINAGYVDAAVLNQAAVERLTSMAERGERATGSRAVITPEERAAIKESADKVGISEKEITRAVREHKLAHPTAQGWAPLVYNRTVVDDGKVIHEYKATPYDFSADKEGKQLEPGTPDYRRRVNAVARSMVDEVRRVFTRANAGDKNAQNILAQAGWYKAMRSRLRQEFGGLGDLFADLLGATSPNTPVRDNWTNAVDALRRASRGDFDELIPQWEAWADKIDELELDFRGWFNERAAEGLTKKAIKALPEYKTKLDALKEARKLPDNLLPTKETGKKYGFNGRNVARAMVDLWRVVKNADPDIARGDTAPKALNFSGNLIGFRERATIDVWAARMLQRLAGGLRIPSMAETGVSGAMREDGSTTLQFGFGQDVFSEAVKRIRADAELKTDKTLAEINDDDLQAVVWFVEKELWTVNNWTNAAGEGGSFELEANLTGPADQARIRELRRIIDSSKSKPEAKAQAREQLAALERTVDRFVGGLSVQMSADTQGTDYVPTDADMARLGHEIRTAIYEADDGSTVLASKALATEGRYGGVERSLDLEVVTREGYDANALWLEMLRQAQAARQDSTFLSRVLRDNEQPDPLRHRPGVEIYFREAAAQAQLEQVLADLAKEGVEFLTVIVDGRRLGAATEGEMPPAVGVRLQYVPEFEQRYGMDDLSGLDDVALADKIKQKADELDRLAARVSASVDGVSFAGQFWYDTQVAFSAEYQEKIDALTARTAEGEAAQAGSGVWVGQPIRAGIESADRQARETASGEPGGDVLGGDAPGTFAQGEVNVRPQQAGDRAGRYASRGLAPLEGAPAIEGAAGPDARLVAVAEQYARDNGIDLRRQAEYVQVDPERAARIAAAYEAMPHAPQDPAVKEAYDNLIRQTVAQYRALEAAGYRFYFFDETNDPYAGNPWNAMRDLRANQVMAVFATEAGFGSDATFDPTENPLLADTGIVWPYGSLDGEPKRVLANDLFRAVHDAFGHGLEGAGFRAQGEENAWQAHVRLFTGSAVAAITSETRGQNSWLNFGPYGEQNRNAKVEDTVFADQKTGLMPEWTWTEGRVADMEGDTLAQGPRGTFNPQELLITLNENADLSTFLHESGHFFLEVMADLASQPGAPQQIVDDMATTLAWFGVPDLATWNSYTLDQKRPYHERWAESFEQYLFEGKAPSQELQPLFRRFRSWLVNVYKSLTQFMAGRDLKLSDDVRKVFDRMIATDEQIAQAEQAAGLLPDFEATNEAIEKLQARSLRDLKWTVNARNKTIKALQKEAANLRKGIEAEVRAEVQAQPLYAAMTWLKKGEMLDPVTGDQIKAEKGFRLNTEALAEMYPETMLGRPDLTRLKGMTAKGGLHPDIVADMFGFESGDALVRNLIDAEPMASVVEGITDQRMLERHGDLVDPQAIEAAANEAVHNEARARSLATELKSQAEMMNQRQDTGRTATNGRPITVNAIAAAAKEFAANLAARRRIKDLKNAAWQHRAAEARAGKAWQQATAKGETQAAVQAKRDQVLNNATVKALQDAQAEVKKIVEFFRRVTKDSNEKTVEKGRDPDVVNAMRAILAAYGVAPRLGKSALEYMDTVAKNDPAMYSALKPGVDAALFNAKPLPEMTVEELRGLNDELRAMWELAKRSRQMEVDGNLLDIEEAADELVNRMEVLGIPLEIPGERGTITEKEERGIKLQFAKAILSRVEQWAERLDGKFGGPFLRLVFQPVKDAADRYRTDRVEYRKKFTALLQAIAPVLPAGPVAAPELGYTFGNARDSGMAEVLHAILHTGNESNKRKLLLGRGWAVENDDGTLDTARWDAFIDRLVAEGKLGKAHYDFAQGVWDLLEQMKPLAQETHRKVFGRYFAEVTADAFVTPFGTYRGGYVPAQTDSRIVRDAKLRELAEGENESMAYAFPSSPSGFTKARVEYNKPLLLDLRALAQHMDKVLLFSHMQGAVTDVRRLLTNKRVAYALDRLDPGAYEGMLIPWLNRSAKQIVETPVAGDRKLSRFLSASRSRAGMALMFANLSNTFQQITGFSTAAVKVKPSLMVKAAAEFTRSPKVVKQRVAEMSAYMKDRMLNEVSALNDVVEEIMLDPTMLERSQAWTQRHAYFLQAAVDNTMSPIIWQAAFNQASEQGMDTNDAVRFADGVVRQTQGTTLPEDVSRFETGPAYGRLFTQFIGYFNMMANTNATAMKQIVDEMGLRKGAGKLLYVALMGLLVPIWVAEAIAQGMRGGPDDEDDDGYLDDWLAAVFGFGTIRGLVAMIPGVAQLGQLVINRFNDNPADDKFSLSPAVSMIESSVGAPFSVYKAIAEEGSAQKAIRDTAAAATLVTGLPFFAAARPIGYLAGVAQDKIDPTGPVDFTRGLVTGTASPESRTP